MRSTIARFGGGVMPLAAMGLAACSDTAVRQQVFKGELVTDPAWVKFGSVPVGGSGTARFSLLNIGDGPIAIASMEVDDTIAVSLPDLGKDTLAEVSIDPVEGMVNVVNVDLTWTPDMAGSFESALSLSVTGAESLAFDLDLYGLALSPSAQFSPQELDFGWVHPSEPTLSANP